MKNYHFILLIFIPQFIFASENTISTKGQLWSSMITSNDVPKGQSNIESNFGYIPFISVAKELSNNQLIDLEFAYQLDSEGHHQEDIVTILAENIMKRASGRFQIRGDRLEDLYEN